MSSAAVAPRASSDKTLIRFFVVVCFYVRGGGWVGWGGGGGQNWNW